MPMLKDLTSIALFLTASVLTWVLQPFAYTFGLIMSIYKNEFSYYHDNLAIAKDQYGNALCEYLFNALLRKKGGYSFGNRDETISSCLGKNQRDMTLTRLGWLVCMTLNTIEKNHCQKSIDESIK